MPKEFKDRCGLAIEEAELNDTTEIMDMMEQAASSISLTTATLCAILICALK